MLFECLNYLFFFTVQSMNAILVQLLNIIMNNEDHFKILRKIQKKPESSQAISKGIGI